MHLRGETPIGKGKASGKECRLEQESESGSTTRACAGLSFEQKSDSAFAVGMAPHRFNPAVGRSACLYQYSRSKRILRPGVAASRAEEIFSYSNGRLTSGFAIPRAGSLPVRSLYLCPVVARQRGSHNASCRKQSIHERATRCRESWFGAGNQRCGRSNLPPHSSCL